MRRILPPPAVALSLSLSVALSLSLGGGAPAASAVAAAVGSRAASPAPSAGASRAASGIVDVARLLRARVAAVKREDGGVAVLLPTTMPLGDGPYHTASSASPGTYNLEIDTRPDCLQANVCLLADFYAVRLGVGHRGALYGRAVTLHGGVHGAYATIQCGAACTPAEVDWVQMGTLYTLHANPTVVDHPDASPAALEAPLIAAADQAIAAGPRSAAAARPSRSAGRPPAAR